MCPKAFLQNKVVFQIFNSSSESFLHLWFLNTFSLHWPGYITFQHITFHIIFFSYETPNSLWCDAPLSGEWPNCYNPIVEVSIWIPWAMLPSRPMGLLPRPNLHLRFEVDFPWKARNHLMNNLFDTFRKKRPIQRCHKDWTTWINSKSTIFTA